MSGPMAVCSFQIRGNIVFIQVNIPARHAGDLGSIPCRGVCIRCTHALKLASAACVTQERFELPTF